MSREKNRKNKVEVPFARLRTCIYSEPKLALRPGPFNQLSCTLVLLEGGIGIFGFAVLVFIAVHRLSVLKHLGLIVCFKTFGFWYLLKSTPGFLDLVSNRVF